MSSIERFEKICRSSWMYAAQSDPIHEFQSRDIHTIFEGQVRALFDDGHYRQSVFEACQIIENSIQRLTTSHSIGRQLMEQAFRSADPPLQMADVSTESGKKEQRGYQDIYAGMIGAVRNPRGHDSTRVDDMEGALSLLGFLSAVCRFLENAGYELLPAT